jgi:hypothetical protein
MISTTHNAAPGLVVNIIYYNVSDIKEVKANVIFIDTTPNGAILELNPEFKKPI